MNNHWSTGFAKEGRDRSTPAGKGRRVVAARWLLGAVATMPVWPARGGGWHESSGATSLHAQAPPEVRQIVTFLFVPGKGGDALEIYRRQLKPLYDRLENLERFRAYREVESPEPLDLIVVSSYAGMAGMDRANEGLRRPGPDGVTALALYGTLSAMTQAHHDQFVEMIADREAPSTTGPPSAGGGLTVFEYLRLVPGAESAYLDAVRSEQRSPRRGEARRSEIGRMLVSDGWSMLRIHRVQSLGDWQSYLAWRRGVPAGRAAERVVAARKVVIVRDVPDLAVR